MKSLKNYLNQISFIHFVRKNFIPILFIFSCVNVNAGFTPIKVACIGNSITYGANLENREKNNYPQQLQNLLGNEFEVKNFAVSGTTLLKKGNIPYWDSKQYKSALAYKPDVVLIKLGTNDSKNINRPFYHEFESDYKDLIASFKIVSPAVRVILILPAPAFTQDSLSIYDPVIKTKLIPKIQNVAYETGCEVIDIHSWLADKPSLFPDGVHPSTEGCTEIAKRLYEVIKLKEQIGFNVFSVIKQEKKISSFYGFKCADFIFNERKCKVVKPAKAAKGLPWIWRARFWGHQPQTDIALLERGFHLVYCDVSELYGNTESNVLWNKFYDYMRKAGLNKKVALEGMSRGGIYIYNWALKNPRKVACVYADAPVLDFKSWPGGKMTGKGSHEDWEIFKKDFNLTETSALQFKDNPLDKAEAIARLGFPMLHVVGDADDVVPVAENTNPFAERVLKAGGKIKVIHKPGVNHHPHSLTNPEPIVNFILQAMVTRN